MSKSKPNILMLVTDHQLYYRHGWDGGQKPLTPHRDALAAKGVTFTRSYAISPLCSPARRSLLCGRYPHTHRNFHNQSNIPFTSPVYFQQLEKAGYESYFFGKWHAGPGDAHSLGAKGFSLPGYGNPYTTVKYAQYCRRLGIPKAVHCIETLFWNNDTQRHFPLLKEGNEAYRCTGTWCGETAFGTTTTDKRSHESFFLAHLAQQELQRLAKQEQSFHLRVDFWGPHQPYFPTQEYLDLYNPKDIGEYGSFCDDLARKPDVYRHMNQPIADEHGNLITPSVFSWETWQRLLHIAYAQTTMIDDAIGEILTTLDQTGLAENTIVLLTSDHGDALASHGGMFDKGSFMTEETIRTPLVIRHPDHIRPNTRCDSLVSTLDIVPTLLDVAGIPPTEELPGKSLFKLLENDSREYLLLESYGQGFRDTKRCRTLITKTHSYTRNEADIDELYDLQQDPYQLNNLADEATSSGLLQSLSDTLHQACLQAHDPDIDIFFPRSQP